MHEMLAAVIRSSPVGIVTLDLKGIVTSWNPAATRIHGWTRRRCWAAFCQPFR